MPINNYTRPQSTITQLLRVLPDPPTTRRNALVIGPQYKLTLFEPGRNYVAYPFPYGTEGLGEVQVAIQALSGTFTAGPAIINFNFTSRIYANPIVLTDSIDDNATAAAVATTLATLINQSPDLSPFFFATTSSANLILTALKPAVHDPSLAVSVSAAGNPLTGITIAAPNYSLTGAAEGTAVVGYRELNGSVISAIDPLQYEVEFSTAKLYADSVLAQVTDDPIELVLEASSYDTLRLSGAGLLNAVTLGDDDLIAGIHGRHVSVGDYVEVLVYNDDTLTNVPPQRFIRRVSSLVPKIGLAAVGQVQETDEDITTIVEGGDNYTASVDRTYTATVTTAGDEATVRFSIADTSGVNPLLTNQALTNVAAEGDNEVGDLEIGDNLNFKFSQDTALDFTLGSTFKVTVRAPRALTRQFDGIKLNAPAVNRVDYDANFDAVNGRIDVILYQEFSGILDESNVSDLDATLVPDATGFTLSEGLGLTATATRRSDDGFSPFVAVAGRNAGKLVASFRSLYLPQATESVIAIESTAQITELLGENHADNLLGKGTYECFLGAQKQKVYALRTAGTTVEDFANALKKVSHSDIFYALAPMTTDINVKRLVADHCTEMSSKTKQNFRRCYLGTDSPGEHLHWGALEDETYRQASCVGGILTIAEASQEFSDVNELSVGDIIKFPGLSTARFIIRSIYSSGTELLIEGAPGEDVDMNTFAVITPSAFEAYRADTPANTVKYVVDVAKSLTNRRAVNVWSDRPRGIDGFVLDAMYMAAEVAGLRSALLPQQGLTMTEMESVIAAPSMYTQFTEDQLDEIARWGTMIVTQDSEGGEIFIRHQLTTEVNKGSLYYEDNVGAIVDFFCYTIKDTFRGYIGKRNVTPDTITEINVKLRNIAVRATQAQLTEREIGPMVISFANEIGEEDKVTVRQDRDLKDHLVTFVLLRVPLPLNGLDHYVEVDAFVQV